MNLPKKIIGVPNFKFLEGKWGFSAHTANTVGEEGRSTMVRQSSSNSLSSYYLKKLLPDEW